MNDEKKLNEMSIDELVHLILDEPDRMDEIFRSTDDLQELYEALENEMYPDDAVLDDAEVYTNSIIEEALGKLSRDYLYEEADYELDLFEEQPEITIDDLREADEELEEFYAENPKMDDRPDSPIPEGMSIEEFSEAMGAYINEFGEIIRPTQTTVQQNGKTFSIYGDIFTEEQIIEGINEDAFYYYDIIDVIRQNEKIRSLVFLKLISLDYDSPEYKDYKPLLDEINSIRMMEYEQKQSPLQQREKQLTVLEAEEKTITEAEALIEKQVQKTGEQK